MTHTSIITAKRHSSCGRLYASLINPPSLGSIHCLPEERQMQWHRRHVCRAMGFNPLPPRREADAAYSGLLLRCKQVSIHCLPEERQMPGAGAAGSGPDRFQSTASPKRGRYANHTIKNRLPPRFNPLPPRREADIHGFRAQCPIALVSIHCLPEERQI